MFEGTDTTVLVGGTTAAFIDESDYMSGRIPLFIGAVLIPGRSAPKSPVVEPLEVLPPLVGPVVVPGEPLFLRRAGLYIGKTIRHVGAAPAA